MSRQHVPDPLLEEFIDGELEDQVASAVALHLDTCPVCATRAAGLEPLAQVFASVDDPEVPVGLIESITLAAAQPARPGPEPVVGAVLLTIAGGIFLIGGGPAQLLAAVAPVYSAVLTILAVVFGNAASLTPLWIGCAVLVVAAALMLTRGLEPTRQA